MNENNTEGTNETEETPDGSLSRKQIGIRLLYTILYFIILGVTLFIIKLCVVFQYIYLFSTFKHSKAVRKFSNKVCSYAYKILRFLTLNENSYPFPFSDLPDEMESPEKKVNFDTITVE